MKLRRVNPLVISSVALAVAFWLSPATGKADSMLYMTVPNQSNVVTFTSSGVPSTFASGPNWPTGLAFNNAGDLFVAGYWSSDITEFAPNGASLGTFATGLSRPNGLAFNSAGNLFVSESGNTGSHDAGTGEIVEFTPSGQSGVFAPANSVPNASALAFNSNGDLYVAQTLDPTGSNG